MTQKEMLLDLFALNSGSVTLYQILQTQLAAEYRARISELREAGYDIRCEKGDTPSENTYILYRVPSDSSYEGVLGKLPAVASISGERYTEVGEIVVNSDTVCLEKLNQYKKVLAGYPEGHIERKKIEKQIKGLS